MGNKHSSSTKSISNATFTGVANLIKLLPTGTVFLYQFLSPVLTHNGHCGTIANKVLTIILVVACAFSCAFSSFTDSYKGSDGMIHYGLATKKGLYPGTNAESIDLSSYRLRFGDFVHAFFAVTVFAVVALLDSNIVECLYPSFESTERVLLMVLPPVIGAVSGVIFMLFPNKRHGIGYQYLSDDGTNGTPTSGVQLQNMH